MKQEKNMSFTFRVCRPSCRWTRGGFKTYEDAVAYAKTDWAFHDRKTGLIHSDVVFKYEYEGRVIHRIIPELYSPIWAS